MKPFSAASGEFTEATRDLPRVALHVRLIAGVPVLFDADGRMVAGQVDVSLHGDLHEVVYARAKILLERAPE